MEALRWLWTSLTQPQPAELAALPQPQERGDRAALLGLAVVNVVLLLLIALVYARAQAPRPATLPASPSAPTRAEAA